MSGKNLKMLVIILISFFLVFSCANTEIIWTDLRDEHSEAKIEIWVNDTDKSSIKKVPLICGKTDCIKLPERWEPKGFSKPSNLGVNYICDYKNNKIEIFLMDYEFYDVKDYNVNVKEKSGVYVYSVTFLDETEGKLCTITSMDNKLHVEKQKIYPDGEFLNPAEILEHLSKSDEGYFFMPEASEQFEKFQKYYLVKGKFFNHFFWISPNTTGDIFMYLDDKILPQWLKEKL